MFGGINPRQMRGMMKRMGISQNDVDASKVIIEKADGSKIIIENPSVQEIKMQGEITYQVSGDIRELSGEVEFNDEDVKTIVEKTGCSEEEAIKTLNETKDLAEAILRLS